MKPDTTSKDEILLEPNEFRKAKLTMLALGWLLGFIFGILAALAIMVLAV